MPPCSAQRIEHFRPHLPMMLLVLVNLRVFYLANKPYSVHEISLLAGVDTRPTTICLSRPKKGTHYTLTTSFASRPSRTCKYRSTSPISL